LRARNAPIEATDLPDATSGLFFARGLDDPNHVESSHEFGFCAHAISDLATAFGSAAVGKSNRFARIGANQLMRAASSRALGRAIIHREATDQGVFDVSYAPDSGAKTDIPS